MFDLPDTYHSTTFDELVEMAEELNVVIPQVRNRKVLYDRIVKALAIEVDIKAIAAVRQTSKTAVSPSRATTTSTSTEKPVNKGQHVTDDQQTMTSTTIDDARLAADLARKCSLVGYKPRTLKYRIVVSDGKVQWVSTNEKVN